MPRGGRGGAEKGDYCNGTHTHSREVMQRRWAPTARLFLCFIYQYILTKDYLRHQRSLIYTIYTYKEAATYTFSLQGKLVLRTHIF